VALNYVVGHEERIEEMLAEYTIRSRLSVVHGQSDPTPTSAQTNDDEKLNDTSQEKFGDMLTNSYLPVASPDESIRRQDAVVIRSSYSTVETSPASSRPSTPVTAQSSPTISTTRSESVFDIDKIPEVKGTDIPQRWSMLSRLKSSISSSAVPTMSRQISIIPSDFRIPIEHPEKHFIDSIGMIIPGVCDREQCEHPLSHFVIDWRLCEPVEYTTNIADHGIAYSDYCRLLAALANLFEESAIEPRPKSSTSDRRWHLAGWSEKREERYQPKMRASKKQYADRNSLDSPEQFRKTEKQAARLNKLLSEITCNWRARGLPVMVCISSFSIFSPGRISESLIQILHVPLESQTTPPCDDAKTDLGQRLSFLDPSSRLVRIEELEQNTILVSHRSPSVSSPVSPNATLAFHHEKFALRDRTRPWALWPNAIPSRNRGLMECNADRYGMDPYFRAWMRANVNSRTRSTSYNKYMIELEDNPFINKRMAYIDCPSRAALLGALCVKGSTVRPKQQHRLVNQATYEHNRRLECRKTIEHGSRLRLVSFSFRQPLYPPHTPEMEELGLTEEQYNGIISKITEIKFNSKLALSSCMARYVLGNSMCPLQWRRAENAMAKVSEYIRTVNAKLQKVVWTIEKIPDVYERVGFGKPGCEWEISAWNGEDPLELLLQLEKWGIIEKRFGFDDDE
jgi:hypothetical protein